ncbi:unannotated protein [freshwater metagenome]|uniref:Unannotated protein n=1 Tax=freshwater metagenome TaxID=449393 RepID=A0A6J7R1E1_9ZZZZ
MLHLLYSLHIVMQLPAALHALPAVPPSKSLLPSARDGVTLVSASVSIAVVDPVSGLTAITSCFVPATVCPKMRNESNRSATDSRSLSPSMIGLLVLTCCPGCVCTTGALGVPSGSQARTSAPTFTVFVPSGTVNEVVCSRVWVPTKVVGSKSSSAGAGDGPAAPGRVISSTLGASAVLAVTLVVTSTVSPGATNAAGFEVLIEIPIGAVLTTFG